MQFGRRDDVHEQWRHSSAIPFCYNLKGELIQTSEPVERFASFEHARVQRNSLGFFSGLDDARCCNSREEQEQCSSCGPFQQQAFSRVRGPSPLAILCP